MKNLPALKPVTTISRPLSASEYFHASIGTSPHTIEPPWIVTCILEAQGTLSAERWQEALDQVIAVNPGLRLRMLGERWRARWHSDGLPTRLRIIPDCRWDGRSDVGAEFLHAQSLPLETGPCSELIIAETNGTTKVIFRAHHAAMDGRGIMHFAYELFRALRGEPLLGTNVSFSDTDFMRSFGRTRTRLHLVKTNTLTGPIEGDEIGDSWRRLTLFGRYKNLTSQVASLLATFYHQHSTLPAVIAIPVDLRRHAPGLHSTQHFSSQVLVPVLPGENETDFQGKLHHMLEHKMETVYVKPMALFRLLSRPTLDRLVSRTPGNYRRDKRPPVTIYVSNFGHFDSAALSCMGLAAHTIHGPPFGPSAGCFIFGMGNFVEITITMPRTLASGGRLDAVMQYLDQRLHPTI